MKQKIIKKEDYNPSKEDVIKQVSEMINHTINCLKKREVTEFEEKVIYNYLHMAFVHYYKLKNEDTFKADKEIKNLMYRIKNDLNEELVELLEGALKEALQLFITYKYDDTKLLDSLL